MSLLSKPPCITDLFVFVLKSCLMKHISQYFIVKNFKKKQFLQSSCTETEYEKQLVFKRIVFSDQIFWESLNIGFIWPSFSKTWCLVFF